MLQVAIVGCGLAGPVLALALHKRNISTAIYEARPEDYVHGGNIALAPNALRVLDHLGVYEAVRVSGFNYEEINFANASGTELGRFRNGSRTQYNFPALRIHRSIVRDELLRRVKQAKIPLYWNKKCLGVESETAATKENEGSATVKFEDGETVTARFIIAADGIHSRVRHFVAPNAAAPSFSGQMGVGGHVTVSELGSVGTTHGLHLPAMLFGANGSFAIMPSSFDGKELGYFTTMESEDKGREGFAKLGQNGDELKGLLTETFLKNDSEWLELVRKLCEKSPPNELDFWPFYTVPHMGSWTSPQHRIILIGDAAHAIPPTGGQGAAMAFEDAETLAHVLDRAFSSKFDRANIPQLFAGWEGHRMKRIEQVLAFTTRGGAVRKSHLTPFEQTIKEWGLWLAFKWMGPDGGAKWLYEYSPENVLAEIM